MTDFAVLPLGIYSYMYTSPFNFEIGTGQRTPRSHLNRISHYRTSLVELFETATLRLALPIHFIILCIAGCQKRSYCLRASF